MKLQRVWLSLFLLVLVGGCSTSGHRKLTIEFLGQRIVIEDEAYKNDEGREVYRVGFDEKSSVVELLFGWLRPSSVLDGASADVEGVGVGGG